MTGDDRAREGFDHLQTAALELIAAARAFLDVAEALVREPGAASAAVRSARGRLADAPGRSPPGRPAGEGRAPPPPEEQAVRPIRLS